MKKPVLAALVAAPLLAAAGCDSEPEVDEEMVAAANALAAEEAGKPIGGKPD